MIFDSINETLDCHRIGKMKGEKLPFKLLWKEVPTKNLIECERIVSNVAQIVLEWGSFMCGFIENKDESFMQLPFQIDDDLLNQIKEDRMFKLLQNDVKEYEMKLQTNDDEFYEVGLEVSNLIFEYLIDDVIAFNEI